MNVEMEDSNDDGGAEFRNHMEYNYPAKQLKLPDSVPINFEQPIYSNFYQQ